ncbi:MAG: lytic transglycosylase domain-containing protein [Deltaproteobacteria bacterium]|nr:lytic transglycosylase domain-containing protein [Deltaproteobacteria bacterium]
MEARRLTWSLAVLLLASLSCNIVPADAPAGRGLPTGLEESERLLLARVSEAKYTGVVAFLGGLPTGLNAGGREALARAVIQESVGSGLAVELVLGVILVESSGNAFAVSSAGAIGLMQLRPSTAEAVAAEIGLPWAGPAQLFDPVANVQLGVAYLERLMARYGDVETALAAYNWGPARIAARLRRGEALPLEYASRVLVAADSSALRAQRI